MICPNILMKWSKNLYHHHHLLFLKRNGNRDLLYFLKIQVNVVLKELLRFLIDAKSFCLSTWRSAFEPAFLLHYTYSLFALMATVYIYDFNNKLTLWNNSCNIDFVQSVMRTHVKDTKLKNDNRRFNLFFLFYFSPSPYKIKHSQTNQSWKCKDQKKHYVW